jgi:hypothetical protein
MLFDRQDLSEQPVVKHQVVGVIAKDRHGRMGMGVYQPGDMSIRPEPETVFSKKIPSGGVSMDAIFPSAI